MRSHIQISLSGEAIPTLAPIGANITYGINMLPIASVSLDSSHLALLCDFESYRRTSATLAITTTFGCLYFDGLIDGISFNQNVGNVGANLILRSKFHLLTEMYSRWPGFHPSTTNPFVRNDTVGYAPDDQNRNILNRINALKDVPPEAFTAPFPDFIKAVGIAKLQAYQDLFQSEQRGLILEDMTALVNMVGQTKINKAIELFNQIDTSAVQGVLFKATDETFVNYLLEIVTKADGNLLEDFMRQLSMFKMNFVVGNNKAFIIPDAGFIKMPHNFSIPRGAQSNTVNVAFPAQYNSISFSDGGYKDIKAAYLIADQNSSNVSYGITELGAYIDPDPLSKGGVLSVELPQYLPVAVDSYETKYSNEMRRNIMGRSSSLKVGQISHTEIKDAKAKQIADLAVSNALLKRKLYDNWAQLEYLSVKYADRVGTIHLFFNPYWAPGVVGTLYTRLPGTYIDFMVQQVNHSFVISAPNSGEASTSISFSCGRYGSRIDGAGVDKVYFYDFDANSASTVASKFVNDVTT